MVPDCSNEPKIINSIDTLQPRRPTRTRNRPLDTMARNRDGQRERKPLRGRPRAVGALLADRGDRPRRHGAAALLLGLQLRAAVGDEGVGHDRHVEPHRDEPDEVGDDQAGRFGRHGPAGLAVRVGAAGEERAD